MQRSREIEKELLKEAETVYVLSIPKIAFKNLLIVFSSRTIISNATCLAWSATAFYKDALQQLVTVRYNTVLFLLPNFFISLTLLLRIVQY